MFVADSVLTRCPDNDDRSKGQQVGTAHQLDEPTLGRGPEAQKEVCASRPKDWTAAPSSCSLSMHGRRRGVRWERHRYLPRELPLRSCALPFQV
jgi:hypothetical protein